jgi:ubiquitin C-terminal hydrolase
MFKHYDQQDSHEFLTILLDWLHDDLNQVIN